MYEILIKRRVGKHRPGQVLKVDEIDQFLHDNLEAGNALLISSPDVLSEHVHAPGKNPGEYDHSIPVDGGSSSHEHFLQDDSDHDPRRSGLAGLFSSKSEESSGE